MTTPPTPVPPAGPTSAALVAQWLQLTGDEAADKVELYAAAANALVRGWVEPLAGVWRADHALGATMLAGRLYTRRNSPQGVATFAAEGAVYVQRNDPDIAMLLSLGSYARPVVG